MSALCEWFLGTTKALAFRFMCGRVFGLAAALAVGVVAASPLLLLPCAAGRVFAANVTVVGVPGWLVGLLTSCGIFAVEVVVSLFRLWPKLVLRAPKRPWFRCALCWCG